MGFITELYTRNTPNHRACDGTVDVKDAEQHFGDHTDYVI